MFLTFLMGTCTSTLFSKAIISISIQMRYRLNFIEWHVKTRRWRNNTLISNGKWLHSEDSCGIVTEFKTMESQSNDTCKARVTMLVVVMLAKPSQGSDAYPP